MKDFKQVIKNIEKFKQENSLTEILVKDEIVYAPLKLKKFEGVKYGFEVFSEEKYKQRIENLGKYQYKHRYYHYEKFDNENDTEVIFVMFNPSSACPDKDDPTIKNCRILAEQKYNSMEIINIFSERNPEVKRINTKDNSENSEFIEKFLGNRGNIDVILAWGFGKEKDYKSEIENVKNLLSNNIKYKITIKSSVLNEIKDYERHPAPTFWNQIGGFKNAAELTKY